tara:strand:- start:1048 stop:1773 length:726 start_codon:yes stop_codon:yes gene_type:complete
MIDRIVQMYDAFMAMPIEGQIITGAGALVVIAATRTVWKIAYPVRWTVASTLRVGAWVLNPRRRRSGKGDFNTVPEFDLSNKKKAAVTYAYYAGTDAIQGLTQEQMTRLNAAVDHYSLPPNGGLSAERYRRQSMNSAEGVTPTSNVVPFDFSTEKKATTAYEYYASDDVAPTLSENQIELIDDAIQVYGLAGNGGLTREKKRRIMRQKMAEVEQASRAPVTVEVQQVEPVQQRQASMENVA